MSAAEKGMDDKSLTCVKDEIDKVFGDTSVSLVETRERMRAIGDYAEEMIGVLNDDIGD